MSLKRFKGLSAERRALVASAVLLDGIEAPVFLGQDALVGNALQLAAEELSALDPELRMPLLGTLLRLALDEIEASGVRRP